MWPFNKNKFKNLKREDVVDAIVTLEKQESDLEEEIVAITKQIDELMAKGKSEKSKDLQLLIAKKIVALREEKENTIKKCLYLMYNVKLAKRLKDAIDNDQFISNTGKISIRNLLTDQKGLAKFLNTALNRKIKDEDLLTSADEIFNDVESAYEENETIYGVQQGDDALLAMFETSSTLDEGIKKTDEKDEKEESISTENPLGE